ncbi:MULTISPECIES: siderophore-interacting protein [Cryobacterium]|uniref:Siderophore-interacting protein n=1 Tax=Cryobacterium breve TaxID=1259258 RepID=A0ABY2J927_9MICO|nr:MULTISPECIES: siderophore-interacting protein [Cryobacterium]TFC97722.1 siderophore-interacting protein [Cryobacterium sp. TmT3-12]TFD00858.1 siderophore-interacting protein [Cryobacterium breve]
MLTSSDAPAATRPRASYRPYAVAVAQVLRLSPSFTRVTFTGPELHRFGTAGLDQRIKLVLPLPESGLAHFPADHSWYDRWRLLPDEHRNPLRTYTVSRARPHLREVDVDFVNHGDGPGEDAVDARHTRGPAARWLAEAAVGDRVAIVGPDAEGENPRVGIEWQPGTAHTLLLAGDETAAPAICAILKALPRDARGAAFIEVPCADDSLTTDAPAGVRVSWLARSGVRGARLEPAVRGWAEGCLAARQTAGQPADASAVDPEGDVLWEVPEGCPTDGLYAWLAGEAGVIKRLRRFLVSESGLDRRQVAFMGYWRDGKSELN